MGCRGALSVATVTGLRQAMCICSTYLPGPFCRSVYCQAPPETESIQVLVRLWLPYIFSVEWPPVAHKAVSYSGAPFGLQAGFIVAGAIGCRDIRKTTWLSQRPFDVLQLQVAVRHSRLPRVWFEAWAQRRSAIKRRRASSRKAGSKNQTPEGLWAPLRSQDTCWESVVSWSKVSCLL